MMNHETFNHGETSPQENTDWATVEEAKDFSAHMAESERENKKLENFNKIVDFFERDASIKKTLVKIAPNEQDNYGDDAGDYADKLYDGFCDIKFDLKTIMNNFYSSKEIENRLKEIEADIANAGLNFQKLLDIYRKDFSAMSEDFNSEVRKTNVGYYLWANPHGLDKDAKSINEILHLIHTSIVNNENILQALPVLAKGGKYEDCLLHGTEDSKNGIAVGVFEKIKDNASYTDVVAVSKDRTIMMVRDSGHALTIDIQKDDDGKYFVDYFVPKICNVDKVNLLPGVRKVKKEEGKQQTRDFTTGAFIIEPKDNAVDEIVNFIAAVPTDDDIEYNF